MMSFPFWRLTSPAAGILAASAVLGCVDELPVDPGVSNDVLDVEVLNFGVMVGSIDYALVTVRLGDRDLTGLYRTRFEALDDTALEIRSVATLPDTTIQRILEGTDSLAATHFAQMQALSRGQTQFRVVLDSLNGTQLRTDTADLFIDERWQSVSAGVGHTCAVTFANTFFPTDTLQLSLRQGGEVFCWGLGEFGALGNGSTSAVTAPDLISTDVRFTEVRSGGGFTCSTDLDGVLYCWGRNDFGSLGIGNRIDQFVPRLTALGRAYWAFETSSGELDWASACAIEKIEVNVGGVTTSQPDATLCWGSNLFGQLGCGTQTACPPSDANSEYWVTEPNTAIGLQLPVVDTLGNDAVLTSITIGDTHACGIDAFLGVAVCWGDNDFGQLGVPNTFASLDTCIVDSDPLVPPVPCSRSGIHLVDIVMPLQFSSLSAGGDFTCGVADGAVYCWGDNAFGKLGRGSETESLPDQHIPTQVLGTETEVFSSVEIGLDHACALAVSGTVYCWGDNSSGQLGLGTTDPVSTMASPAQGGPFVVLSAGDNHTCAIQERTFDLKFTNPDRTVEKDTAGGSIYCWGENIAGALGNGTLNDSNIPVRVAEPQRIF